MSTTSTRRRIAVKDDEVVTPLELFFDLVFVYALTQVTALLATHLNLRGMVQGLVVLALVWWCWVGYSWLGNVIRADEGLARAAFIAVVATMFIAALAIPESFADLPGGVSGPMTLAVCYAIVRYIHLGLFWYAARNTDDADLAQTLLRFGTVATASVIVIITGAALGGDAQLALWIVAVGIDYFGTKFIGPGGWRLYYPKHFNERHGLIVIIAIGESIVSIGVGATELPVSWPLIIGAVLGIFLCAMLWWVYFDVTTIAAEHVLSEAEGAERTALARDGYSFLHLPMVAGIVLAALGLKKALTYIAGGVSDGTAHSWHDQLHGIPQVAIHLGPAVYLLALVTFRYRIVRSIGTSRPIAALALLATIPIGSHIPVMYDLLLVTAILTGLVIFEYVRFAETRHRIRYGHDLFPPHDH
ncbi:MAG TPA: low temperature requirement protein A [Miltoncostaeales bacterium]|nr:low temperature requirement protein A [Miltoncostaeales bacterium]